MVARRMCVIVVELCFLFDSWVRQLLGKLMVKKEYNWPEEYCVLS